MTCSNLPGNSPHSCLNYMQTYATTDLFWQPITCFLSFAFSIFHAHFIFQQQKVWPPEIKTLKFMELNHSDESNDVMLVLSYAA